MLKKFSNSGISLISLIITIIVIIILAAIVIFSGMGTPEKAQFSKVISDIDNVQTAVDQAYYGLYTEKAVAGEVWTKSQFYEAVATGKTNRDELNGTGLIEIADSSLVKINLPKYEGRKWYVAVSDMSDTVKTGSAVLSPGFESDGKVYATLLDVQNGGGDRSGLNSGSEDLTEEEKEILEQIHFADYVNYMDTNVENTDTWWRVLDKKENGDIYIVLCSELGPETTREKVNLEDINVNEWVNELNRLCKDKYTGKGAIEVRNMSDEDIYNANDFYKSEFGVSMGNNIDGVIENGNVTRYAVYSADTPTGLLKERKVTSSNGETITYEPFQLGEDADLNFFVYDDLNGNKCVASKNSESVEENDGGYKVPKYENDEAKPVLISCAKYNYNWFSIENDIWYELTDGQGGPEYFLLDYYYRINSNNLEVLIPNAYFWYDGSFSIEYTYKKEGYITPIVKLNVSSLEKNAEKHNKDDETYNVWSIK